ncbi:hypothetical protein OPV22_028939 [Ensete ventricosum]|uniref:Uncharacterized protein n=1 Tax=Ensete ventricosum TaxID=4639 RepID=A0AAV8PZS1_ENSVE|nr:hypothetical protein OPV22_028939 [Ensete ventricosum]
MEAATSPSSPTNPTLRSYQNYYFYSVPASPTAHCPSLSDRATTSRTNSDTESETCEFKFATSPNEPRWPFGGQPIHDSHILPLKLPPRLQSPSFTPPPSHRGSMAKRRFLGLGFKTSDFDPFMAAVERIQKEENPPYQRTQSCEPLCGKNDRNVTRETARREHTAKARLEAIEGRKNASACYTQAIKRRVLGLRLNNNDFDPFMAAVERIRKEDSPPYQRTQYCEPLRGKNGRKVTVDIAPSEKYTAEARLEAVKDRMNRQGILACFRFRK